MGLSLSLDLSLTGTVVQGGGGSPPPLLTNPQIGLIGPSTTQYEAYGLQSPGRTGFTTAGAVNNALMVDRRGQVSLVPAAASPFFDGNNQGRAGAVFAQYPAEIAALATAMGGFSGKVIIYDAGRNPIENGATVADYVSGFNRDLDDIRSRGDGTTWIIIRKLWKKPLAFGGQWGSGGSYRTTTDQVNAAIDTIVAQRPYVIAADAEKYLYDSVAGDTIPNITVSDKTHSNSKGGKWWGKAIQDALALCTTSRSYPAVPAENTIPAFSGTGGTKSGATGNVFDGWTLNVGSALLSCVASQPTINGKPYQRLTIGQTAGQTNPATGSLITLSKSSAIVVPAGVKQGLRFRVKMGISAVQMLPWFQFGISGFEGDTTEGRATLLAGTPDDPSANAVTATGTTFQSAGKLDLSEATDWWLETPNPVLGAAGNSNVSIVLQMFIGAFTTSSDTLAIDFGEFQQFNWPG